MRAGILVLLGALAVAARAQDDNSPISVVRGYYEAAIPARDPERALSFWAENSPHRAPRRRLLEESLRDPVRIELVAVREVLSQSEGKGRRLVAEVEVRAAAAERRWDEFGMVSRGDQWKIWSLRPAGAAQADRIAAAMDPAERRRLAVEVPGLPAGAIARELLLMGDAEQRPARSLELYDAALETARYGGDATQEARAHFARTIALAGLTRITECELPLREALVIFRRLNDDRRTGLTLYRLGMILSYLDRDVEALPCFEEASGLAEKAGDTGTHVSAVYRAAYVRSDMGEFDRAFLGAQRSLELARAGKLAEQEMRSLQLLGQIERGRRRYGEAVAFFRDAALRARELGDSSQERTSLLGGAIAAVFGERPADQVYFSEQTVNLLRRLRRPEELAEALVELGLGLGTLARWAESIPVWEEAASVWSGLEKKPEAASALRQLGSAQRLVSQFEAASASLNRSAAMFRELGDRQGEARTLSELAELLADRGDLPAAAVQGERVAALFRELSLPLDEAEQQRKLGIYRRDQGLLQDAFRHFESALRGFELAKKAVSAAAVLGDMGTARLLTGFAADAEALFRRALDRSRTSGSALAEVRALNALGAACQEMGRYTEARTAFEQCREIGVRLGSQAIVDMVDLNLAGLLAVSGRPEEAIRAYRARLESPAVRTNPRVEVQLLANLGAVLGESGQRAEAIRTLDRSLARAVALKDAEGEAQAQRTLGGLYRRWSEYGESLSRMHAALAIYRRLGQKPAEAELLGGISSVYLAAGRRREALDAARDSRDLFAGLGNRRLLARAHAVMGGLQLPGRDAAGAERSYDTSLQLLESTGDDATRVTVLQNLALALGKQNRLEDALRRAEEARILARTLGDSRSEAHGLLNLGTILLSAGRWSEAQRRFGEAAVLARKFGAGELVLRAEFGVGRLHAARGRLAEASEAFLRSTREIDRVRAGLREQSLQTGYLDSLVLPFHELADCLVRRGDFAGAFSAVERAKGRALADMLSRARLNVKRSMTADERRLEGELETRLSGLTAELGDARNLPTDSRLKLEAELDTVRSTTESFRRGLFLRLPELRDGRAATPPLPARDAARLLGRNQPGLLILSYLCRERDTLLFVLKANSPSAPLSVHRLPIGREALSRQVGALSIECSQPAGRYQSSAAHLYRLLLLPAHVDIARAAQVVIVPDGPLHSLPFQVLMDAKGRHLVELAPVSYAPSVTALARMAAAGDRVRAQPNAGLAVAAFGRPEFQDRHSDLPSTESEVRTIAGLFPRKARLLIGPEATEANLRRIGPEARYLHLATHGLVNEHSPLYSAVALSRAGDDDGLLEARELMELELHAELTVFSACETALGRQFNGEGVLGLAWAGFVAGSAGVIVTHWQVEDGSTGKLMAGLYRTLAARGGTGKAAALRTAQLAVLRDGRHRHPFYWAPFVLLGDWR